MSGNVRINVGDEHKDFRYTNTAQGQHGGSYYTSEKRQTISPNAIGAASRHQGGNYIKTSDGRLIPVESGATYQSGYRAGSGDISGTQHISTSYQQVPGESYRETRTVYVEGQPQRQTNTYYESRNSGGAVAGGALAGGATAGSARGVSGGYSGNYEGGAIGGNRITQTGQRNNIVTQQREVERPQYQKLYSNNSGVDGRVSGMDGRVSGGAGYDANGRVSGDVGLGKKKSKCCNPAILALLGCLALAGIILGVLFGTGVLGGKSQPQAVGEFTTVQGQRYPSNSVTVETTYIENDVEDGQPESKSSALPAAGVAGGAIAGGVGTYLINKDKDGKPFITKDGQNYPVEQYDNVQLVNINNQDNVLLNGELYPIKLDGDIPYIEVNGKKQRVPEEDKFELSTDKQGNKHVNLYGKQYDVQTINGYEYFTVDGQKYIVYEKDPYPIAKDGTFEKDGNNYRINDYGRLFAKVDGKEYPVLSNNGYEFVQIDGKKYLLRNGEKYAVETENGDDKVTINGEKVNLGPVKTPESVTVDGFKFIEDPVDGLKKVEIDGKYYEFYENNGFKFVEINDQANVLYKGKTYRVETAADGMNYINMDGEKYNLGRLDNSTSSNLKTEVEVQPQVVEPITVKPDSA